MPEQAPGSIGAGLRRCTRWREEGGRAVIARGGRPNLHAHGAQLPALRRLWLGGAPRHRLGRPWAARAARQVGLFLLFVPWCPCAPVRVLTVGTVVHIAVIVVSCIGVRVFVVMEVRLVDIASLPRRLLTQQRRRTAREGWRAGPRSPTCVASFTEQDARSTSSPGPGRSWGADGA